MYAIIEDSGNQLKVAPGDVVQIDLREVGDAKSITFDRVLLVGGSGSGGEGDESARIGTPYVSGASVSADVLGEVDGDKVEIVKFTVRKGFRKHKGHRQRYLRVRIGEIRG